MNLDSLSVKSQLWAILGGGVCLLLALVAVVWLAIGSISGAADEMGQGKDVVADILPPPLYILEAEFTVLRINDAPADELAGRLDKLVHLKKEFDERNAYWEKAAINSTVKASLLGEQKRTAEEFWQLALGDFAEAARRGDDGRKHKLAEQLLAIYRTHRSAVEGTVKLANGYAENTLKGLQDTSSHVRLLVILLAGGGGLAAAIFVALVTASILRRLGGEPSDMQAAARRIAQGDLTVQLAVTADDRGSLLATIAEMQSHLRNTIRQSRVAADSVATAAQQLAVSSQQVAQSSSRQSEAASSMSASIEEVTVSIGAVADNATQTHAIAGETGDLSVEGKVLVQNTIDEIHKIAESVAHSSEVIQTLGKQSGQISSIVNVIKEIADQTNLLALNAAIEAARAGEQGRGFAVVADEVRKLAERTTSSTQEIAGMIDAIQQGTQNAVLRMEEGRAQVDDGVQKAARTSQAMERIQGGMQKMLRSVEEISDALHEQSAASTLMAQEVEKIARMTEENYSAVGEVSRSAELLQQLATSLKSSVDKFQV